MICLGIRTLYKCSKIIIISILLIQFSREYLYSFSPNVLWNKVSETGQGIVGKKGILLTSEILKMCCISYALC